MELTFTLFLSGSPQDYEWLPQLDNHAKQVCEKYFNLPPAETPHSSDFYVELFPINNYSYYTYLHRKSVNGMPREGAHIALTMRISGGYCNQPNTIYKLLENVYMQYIDGKIMQRTGDGEIYLIPSLMKCEDMRKLMENTLGQELQLISRSFLPFGNEVSKSRQPSSVKYFPADSDNEQLLSELRKTHKLKLIPSFDYHAEKTATNNKAIEQLQQQIVQKDSIIKKTNDQLKKETQKSDNSYYEVLQNINGRLNTITDQISQITNTADITKSGIVTNKLIRHLLPWGLLFVALIFIIVIGLRSTNSNSNSNSDNINEFQDSIKTLNDNINELQDSIKTLNDTIQAKDSLLKSHTAATQDIKDMIGSSNENSTPTNKTTAQNPNISVGGTSDKCFYAGETYPLSMISYKEKCTFIITKNDDNALSITADGKLKCLKPGSGEITAYDGEKMIKTRTITVIEQTQENK